MDDVIKNYKFKSGLPLEFELNTVSDLFSRSKSLMINPHRSSFYHIIWIQEGNPIHYVDFNPIQLHPGSVLFVAKDCVNVFDNENEFDGKLILFTDQFFCKNPDDSKFLKSTILFSDFFEVSTIYIGQQESVMKEYFQLMETEFQNENDLFNKPDVLRNLLHCFLLLSERIRRHQGFKEVRSGPDLEYFVLFKDLIEKHFTMHKSAAGYASDLNITLKRLNKATVGIFGKTPKQIIDERVLLEAKRLLVHTAENIKEISYELGFNEPTNFIKYFHKHEHMTPIEFRAGYSK